jgi:CRISPR-associated regulatory protein, DevR family
MKKKGLTITIIFLAESANYGESIGNVATLKKISRNRGEQYTYISRQAIRYNIIDQLEEKKSPVSKEKGVFQFKDEALISDYPELDFFGYMKTGKSTVTRSAVVRLSNAISLETFKGDLEFLTNKGLSDRYNKENKEQEKYNDIAQSEIHKSYYKYTVTIDLDRIGIDESDKSKVSNEEKSRRIKKLLDTISLLYRDIRGRREDLKPLFVIGGVYDIKNPFFENTVDVKENKILVDKLCSGIYDYIEKDTISGIVKEQFENDTEVEVKLKEKNINVLNVPEFFKQLKEKVDNYYTEKVDG